MTPHLLCVGGEDHSLRIPFLRAMTARGFQVSAAGTGDAAPFQHAGIAYHRFQFERFVNPLADLSAMRQLDKLIAQLRPQLIQSFDTKTQYPGSLRRPSHGAAGNPHDQRQLGLFLAHAARAGAAASPAHAPTPGGPHDHREGVSEARG